MAIYDYHMTKVFTDSVVVDDAGNCSLECTNEEGEFYYIKMQACEGFVYCMKFGPVCPDLDFLDGDYSFEYRKFKYSIKGVDKEIKGFINDPKKQITSVVVVDEDTVLNAIPGKEVFIPAL